MKVIYRDGRKEDSANIARLDDIASGGALEFLFHDLVPNMTPVQIVTSNLEKDDYPYTYRNVIIAEHGKTIIGMALSFPGKYHRITKEMETFFPQDRIDHFREFFTAPVKDYYFLDAICVDEEFRGQGIGTALIEQTKKKTIKDGYNSLSLVAFKDNTKGLQVYKKNGFKVIDQINLAAHELIPHKGGCVLMKVNLDI